MLAPINAEDFDRAARLLNEGFPERTEAYWRDGLDRLDRFGANREADLPVGWFMLAKSEPVGVLLTPASLRDRSGGGQRRFVNYSSWYVREAQRLRAPLMLKRLLDDAEAVHLDLTPTPQVQRMIELLGMVPVNRGIVVELLVAAAAMPAGRAHARVASRGVALPVTDREADMIERHRALGCLPILIEDGEGQSVVVVRRTRTKGLTSAEIVFTDSHARLARALPALARVLLVRGFALLLSEGRTSACEKRPLFRRRNIWFAKGADFHDRTDHLASELCLLGW